MISVRIHGRGGQGVKKAAQILARACYLAGWQTQDFAIYGAERKGAPVTSFVRIDKKRITTRGYIFDPDYLIILDDTLELSCYMTGIKKDAVVLVNSHRIPDIPNLVCIVDGTGIALQETGSPIPNVVMLGAFMHYFSEKTGVTFEHLAKAVEIELGARHKEAVASSIRAAKKCYEKVVCQIGV